MPNWSVRPATLDDAEAITRLLQASYPALMKTSYDAAILAIALPYVTKANPALLGSGTYYLCSSASESAVGCDGWTFERPSTQEREPGLGHIRHFATHPDWCGKGIGRTIYERCEAEARTLGVCEFECHAGLNAEGFYRALGFRTLEPMQIPLGQGIPALLMKKSLV